MNTNKCDSAFCQITLVLVVVQGCAKDLLSVELCVVMCCWSDRRTSHVYKVTHWHWRRCGQSGENCAISIVSLGMSHCPAVHSSHTFNICCHCHCHCCYCLHMRAHMNSYKFVTLSVDNKIKFRVMCPLFEKFLRVHHDHVRTVPGNMHINFEVLGFFNHFGAISI